MPRGGARPNTGGQRPGAGRPTAATTRRTRAIADQIAADGEITPVEAMVGAMRHYWNLKRADGSPDWDARDRALAIAKDVAPYLHPRLQAVRVDDGEREKTHEDWLAELDDDDDLERDGAAPQQLIT
jgi:hypothetical protein